VTEPKRDGASAGCRGPEGMFRALDEVAEAAEARGRLDETLRDRLTQLWMRVWLLRATRERAIEEGDEPDAPSFSVLAVFSEQIHAAIAELGPEALGPDAAWSEDDEPLVRRMLDAYAPGGTVDLRAVLAERVLGLPP
jgi:hypothetical protein